MKYGAPIAAVNTPAGTSIGKKNVRPIKSAAVIKIAPISADSGIKAPNDEPTSFRAICGASNPTKLIPPANATALPVKAVLISNSANRFF